MPAGSWVAHRRVLIEPSHSESELIASCPTDARARATAPLGFAGPHRRTANPRPLTQAQGKHASAPRGEEEPPGGAFTFVSGVQAAVERAQQAAAGKDVHVMGGAEIIRQALAAGIIDELTIIIAPVVMGAGKRLFDGFSQSLELEHLGVRQSPHSTFIQYQVQRS